MTPATELAGYAGGAWSPYLVGMGIGLLTWFTFRFAGKAIGASSFYATLAGWLGRLLAPRHTALLAYFKSHPPRANWGFWFVLSTIAGGFLAAWSGGEFRGEWVPAMWRDRFGDGVGFRAAVATGGGILMAFGARMAGGCTSGHGLSGTLQLSPGSWIAVILMFAGGIISATLLYSLP